MAAWSGCKDCDDPTDPDCGNYDPCFGQQEFVPHFKMYDAISHWSGEELALPGSNAINNYIMIEGDTLLTRRVIFIAPEEYDSVWWRIGAEASYRQGKGVRIFFEDLYPENLPIIMIGKRQPNVACFPNEQAIDTVQRFLTLKPSTDTKVTGQWIGAYDTHPDDSFEINIRFPLGDNYAVTIDYFPDRDVRPTNAWDISQFAAPVSLDKFWSRSNLATATSPDRYGRRYRVAYINGEVYGNNYQYLKIALKYSYDSDPTFELLPLTFNARRK
jgi:hypothetical protein